MKVSEYKVGAVCTSVTCGQGATRCKCIFIVRARRGWRNMLAGAIICIQYLAKIDTVILIDDLTEYSPMTRPNNHQ